MRLQVRELTLLLFTTQVLGLTVKLKYRVSYKCGFAVRQLISACTQLLIHLW